MTQAPRGHHRGLIRAYRYQAPASTEGALPDDPSGARITPTVDGPAPDVIAFGMKLFLASLTMVFGGTFVAYAVFRWRERDGWESILDTPEIMGLVAASVLLVIADVAAMRALKKADTRAAARKLTLITIIFASIYLVVQSISWVPLMGQVGERIGGSIVGGTLTHAGGLFLMLTFAHAVHVFGGIVANAIVLMRSKDDRGPARDSLRMLYSYWRFLTVMWVAVLIALAI
jgi:heme/copper-type cytochrome/quinol oxidase subunit 3